MMPAQEVNYIPSLNKRLDDTDDCIACLSKDVESIKIGLGYKEKYNGEFRTLVEDTDKNLNERLQQLELQSKSISATLTSLKWILALVLPVFAMLLVEILIKL